MIYSKLGALSYASTPALEQQVLQQETQGSHLDSIPPQSISNQRSYKDIDHDHAIVDCIPSISNVVAHYFKTEAEREDALQDILTQLVLKKDSFRGDKPFSHWALRISSRTCISKIRYSKIRNFFSIDHENAREVQADIPTPEKELQVDEHKQLLHKAIEQLKAKDRELILLCDIMGKSDTETQTILDIKSAGTFRVRKHRAREKLKHILGQLGYQHETSS